MTLRPACQTEINKVIMELYLRKNIYYDSFKPYGLKFLYSPNSQPVNRLAITCKSLRDECLE